MARLATLQTTARTLGVELDARALERFERYRQLLLEWNQRFNLTRVTDPDEIEIKLFADALALVPSIQRFARATGSPATRSLIDVGSGAGFPGLALKIVDPSLDLVLLEATAKKVRFLEAVVAELDFEAVRAIHGRAEEVAHQPTLRGRFDLAVARAVARLPALLELCMPFCRPGGWGLFPKGAAAGEEAAEAARAMSTLRCRLVGIEQSGAPELAATRIVIVEQVAPAPKGYPRRPGLPAKSPL